MLSPDQVHVCAWCEEPILKGEPFRCIPRLDEEGVTPDWFHHECAARMIIGSLSHVMGTCSCFCPGSDDNDPPGMTRRDAARAALTAFLLRQHLERQDDADQNHRDP